ncbi:MAG TPA: hypothetical protein VL263_14640 [Vicinamibacterales bacterium]|nr:hypothetical protein [Vicinamibacterales bacterium]
MFEGIRRLSARLGSTPRFAARTVDAATGGRILVLEGQPGLRAGAVAESVRGYTGGQMPFEAILVDFNGADYRFSSDDLGSLLSAIAAWGRRRVAPCAIVLTSSAGTELQQLFDLCKVNTIESLRIVGSADAGLEHIRAHLERRSSDSQD